MAIYEQTNVRLPAGIKAWLKDEAKRNRRSLSAEVIVRLERTRKSDRRKRHHTE